LSAKSAKRNTVEFDHYRKNLCSLLSNDYEFCGTFIVSEIKTTIVKNL